MNKNVFLYGASGHSKVIIDILELNNFIITNIFDDDESKQAILDYKVEKSNAIDKKNELCIISIGNNKIRQKIAEKYALLEYAIAIHPKSVIAKSVVINSGSVVMAGAIINASTLIGKHCIINTSASIDHDCVINNYSHISPNATLCGNVTIGCSTQIGAGSVIIQGITIGDNVIVGAGSVVVKDIPSNTIVVGNPAKSIKKN